MNGNRRQVAVIANPLAGDGLLGGVREALTERRVEFRWVETSEEHPGADLTRSELDQGADLIIAVGGDGTVRACAEGVAGRGVPLAVVPGGTGNLLAGNLGLPDEVEAAIAAALTGDSRVIDAGTVNGEVFTVMAGAGLDGVVMAETDPSSKDRLGTLAYVAEGVRHLDDRVFQSRLVIDGEVVHDGEVSLLLVGNFGGLRAGLDVFPDSDPADGGFDLLATDASGLAEWLSAGWMALTGRNGEKVRRWHGRSVQLQADPAIPYELDGEARPATSELSFDLWAGAVRLRIPREETT